MHITEVHIVLLVLIITIGGIIYNLLFFWESLIFLEVFDEVPQDG